MLDCESHLLEDYPNWGLLLEAYALLQAEEPMTIAEPEPEGDQPANSGTRWFPRVCALNGIEPEQLSPIHGRLIALGWLRFQLEDAQSGVQYRLSPEGRKALGRYVAVATDN